MDVLGQKYVSAYRNEGYLPISRRLYASLLDAFLLFVVSFCCLLASSAIAGSVPAYAEKIDAINSLRVAMYEEQEETKLFAFPKGEDGKSIYDVPVEQEKVFEEYAYSNILYTYQLFSEDWNRKFTLPDDDPSKELAKENMVATSYSSDRLAYFYVGYAQNHNEDENLFPLPEGQSYEAHFKTVLRNASKGAEWHYFEEDDASLPALKVDYAHILYRYLRFNEGGQEGLTAYNFLVAQYQGVFEEAQNQLFHSKAYQALYQPYRQYYADCSYVVSAFSFISYVVSYLLIILLPTLLFKNGETIGLYVFKGALLHRERLEVSKGQVLLRDLFAFFSFYPVMLFSCFFAGGLNSGWMYPLFSIGSVGVSLFNLTVISFIFPIANLFCSLIRKDRTGFGEWMSRTIVIDRRYYLEHAYEEEAAEENEKEQEAVQNVLPDRPYFDSSCFDNTERKNVTEMKEEENSAD